MIARTILVSLSMLALVSACAPMTPQDHLEKAASYVQKGDSELIKAEGKFNDGSRSSAVTHFNDAIGEYNKAVEQIAAAELPGGNEDALNALKKGLDEAKRCLEELEKGDYDKAEQTYVAAQDSFASALLLLN